MAIFTWPDRFTSFFTAQSHKKKPIRTEPNGLNQQRQKAKGWAHTKGRQCGRYFWLPLLVILCIILIFIYILSILHNARVTTEIVGWQFINT